MTPAHDANDFLCGQRHGLPAISIFLPSGKVHDEAPEGLKGLDRFDARKKVVEILTEHELFVEKKVSMIRMLLIF